MSMPLKSLPYESLGLCAERVLVPIDLTKCPLEIFQAVNGCTRQFGAVITLLYVMDREKEDRNVRRQNSRRQRAELCLRYLGEKYLRPGVEGIFKVREGCPADEIVAEAGEARADLLILPTYHPGFWEKLWGWERGRTWKDVLIRTQTRVFVVDVQSRVNSLRLGTS